MEDISVIIPCYNSGLTIERTLLSLRCQTYKHFKVILIDDGSTDKTLQIVNKCISICDFPIIVKQQNNSGASIARNRAISLADTKYLTFLDSDDIYDVSFLQILHDEICKNDADIAVAKYEFVKIDERTIPIENIQIERIDKFELFDIYLHHRIEHVNFCCGIYKKQLIDTYGFRFPIGVKYGEDTEFFFKYIKQCDAGAILINNALYKYTLQINSAMHKITYERVQNIYVCMNIREYWANENTFMRQKCEYLVYRAVWAVAKDFFESKKYFSRLQYEFDVKSAMKFMVKYGDEKSIKITAACYLIHPILFKTAIKYGMIWMKMNNQKDSFS